MSDRLVEFEEQLRNSRERLEALADRAARLRSKLEADTALLFSMERLAEQSRTTSPAGATPEQDFRDEDGFYVSDAWEIALINEEGK